MPLIECGDIQIHYELIEPSRGTSERESLVLVNGLADDMSTWDAQVPAFTQAGYRVLRFDNRGVGLSSKPAGPYTAEILAEDLHNLLLKLSITRFHLLGISMGGMIAQSYALLFPNVTNDMEMLSISLCCTYAEPTRFCSRMFQLWHDMAIQMSIQDVMRDVILWCFTVSWVREKGKELEEIDEAMANIQMTKESYLAQLNVIQIFDSTKQLTELQNNGKFLGNLGRDKVMVLAGEEDILIPVQLSKELFERLDGAQWKTVRGGHCCALEHADEFNRTVIDFLKSV